MTQRQEIIERLNGLEMEGGSHAMLSAICKAVLPHGDAWTLRRCADLRDRLVRLLGEVEQPKERDEGEEEESEEGHTVEQLRRESVVTRLRMAQQGGYDGSTGFVRGNVYQLFGVGEKSYDSIYFLAGNIATEVEREIASAKSAAYDQGYAAGYDAGFASADDWLSQHEDAMAEHGFVRLPKDADGEYIHIGDVMDSDHYEDGTVVGLQFFDTANKTPRVLIAIRPHGWDTPTWRDPDSYHHKQPTVEEVLREFAEKMSENMGLYTGEVIDADEWRSADSATIAEYAAKLRLAGDAE